MSMTVLFKTISQGTLELFSKGFTDPATKSFNLWFVYVKLNYKLVYVICIVSSKITTKRTKTNIYR